MIKRSWKEINLKAVENNYLQYKKLLFKHQNVMAVVKANAYGHGDEEIAKTLQNLGVKLFAVSNLLEGVKLRENGVKGEILVLGYTPKTAINQLIAYDITQTVYSKEYLDTLLSFNKKIKVHLAVNTGMNRIGFNLNEVDKRVILKLSKLNLEGIFTHLSCADEDKYSSFTLSQIEKFENFLRKINIDFKYVHYANSIGSIKYNLPFANTVRLGVLLYGLHPCPNFKNDNFYPALTWKSVVSMVKNVNAGESVGYGNNFIATKKTKVATISCGYADGYDRRLSNCGFVLINGKRAKVIGNICMDQFMVDASEIPKVKQDDEVVLIGKGITAEEFAKLQNTINYEVVCKISNRVESIYLRN